MKGFSIWLPGLLLAPLAGCGDGETHTLPGYVEGEYIRVASGVSGRLLSLPVQRGDSVQAGQALFVLEQDSEQAALAEAAARSEQAQAQADDLASGRRPEELAAIAASLDAARAAARQSQTEWRRQSALAQAGYLSSNALSGQAARRDADAARVRELESQLRAAKLAGRDANRRAAAAASRASTAQLKQAQWRLEQKTTPAAVGARVEDIYYRVGEWAPAGSPVLSLLPTAAVKVRFFVPETRLHDIKPGQQVHLSCDGCGAPIAATVRYLSRQAEFTPPMLYSKENRAQLVYLAEAQPAAADAAKLRLGQPVDVQLPKAQP